MFDVLSHFQGLLGIGFILSCAVLISENRAQLPQARWIAGALVAQFVLAVTILQVPLIWDVIGLANDGVQAIEEATLAGSSYMFSYLGGADLPFVLKDGVQPPIIIAFQILPLIIVFSALSALLWHWRVLQWIVRGLSWGLQKSLGVSGVVGLSGGANVFLGVVESPLVVRAYFEQISRAELFAIMVLAMATISGAILVLYATTLGQIVPNAVGHMISASIISLPAAILVARLMVPGRSDTPERGEPGLKYAGSFDAFTKGATDGVQLVLVVIAVIIAIFAMVALIDMILSTLPALAGEALTLKRLFGWLFAPLMWMMGVPWSEAGDAGQLMGTKAILNEYVAYLEMAALPIQTFSGKSQLIVVYALCGFANLASVGLIISTIGTLAPSRRSEVAGLGMKSWLAGNFATLMTGAVVGVVTWQ